MIRSHIGSTRNCGVVFKFEKFSHLSDRSFGLSSLLLVLGTYHWCFHWEPIRIGKGLLGAPREGLE